MLPKEPAEARHYIKRISPFLLLAASGGTSVRADLLAAPEYPDASPAPGENARLGRRPLRRRVPVSTGD